MYVHPRLCNDHWVKTYDRTVIRTESRVRILRDKQRTPRQIIHWENRVAS